MKSARELASKAWRERSAHDGLSEREVCRLVERAQEEARDEGARVALAAIQRCLLSLHPDAPAPVVRRHVLNEVYRIERNAGLVSFAPGALEANEEARK